MVLKLTPGKSHGNTRYLSITRGEDRAAITCLAFQHAFPEHLANTFSVLASELLFSLVEQDTFKGHEGIILALVHEAINANRQLPNNQTAINGLGVVSTAEFARHNSGIPAQFVSIRTLGTVGCQVDGTPNPEDKQTTHWNVSPKAHAGLDEVRKVLWSPTPETTITLAPVNVVQPSRPTGAAMIQFI